MDEFADLWVQIGRKGAYLHILQGDLAAKLFLGVRVRVLLSWKLNLHQARLACLGNQEIASGKRLDL